MSLISALEVDEKFLEGLPFSFEGREALVEEKEGLLLSFSC